MNVNLKCRSNTHFFVFKWIFKVYFGGLPDWGPSAICWFPKSFMFSGCAVWLLVMGSSILRILLHRVSSVKRMLFLPAFLNRRVKQLPNSINRLKSPSSEEEPKWTKADASQCGFPQVWGLFPYVEVLLRAVAGASWGHWRRCWSCRSTSPSSYFPSGFQNEYVNQSCLVGGWGGGASQKQGA